jgi:hypothetical protein
MAASAAEVRFLFREAFNSLFSHRENLYHATTDFFDTPSQGAKLKPDHASEN